MVVSSPAQSARCVNSVHSSLTFPVCISWRNTAPGSEGVQIRGSPNQSLLDMLDRAAMVSSLGRTKHVLSEQLELERSALSPSASLVRSPV